MRDKISKIVGQYRHSSFDTHEERKEKWNKCTDELTALMCYREVRAFYWAHWQILYKFSWRAFEYEAMSYFVANFPKETIREAIEKVKNEQK